MAISAVGAIEINLIAVSKPVLLHFDSIDSSVRASTLYEAFSALLSDFFVELIKLLPLFDHEPSVGDKTIWIAIVSPSDNFDNTDVIEESGSVGISL